MNQGTHQVDVYTPERTAVCGKSVLMKLRCFLVGIFSLRIGAAAELQNLKSEAAESLLSSHRLKLPRLRLHRFATGRLKLELLHHY